MENTPSTPKKLLQKVYQLILVGFSVVYNILTVYQSRTPGWPPKPLNDHNSVTINSNLMILVSIPRFLWAKNTLRSLKMMLAYYVTQKSNMASKMAANTSKWLLTQIWWSWCLSPGFLGARNTLRLLKTRSPAGAGIANHPLVFWGFFFNFRQQHSNMVRREPA